MLITHNLNEDLSLAEEAGGVALKIATKAHSILSVELKPELDIVAEP